MLSKDKRTQSPTNTVVLSRFFTKEEDIADNVRVDEPPPKTAPASARGRPRASRAVGRCEINSSDIVAPEEEIMSALAAELPTEVTEPPRDRAVSPSLRTPAALTKEQQFNCYMGNCAPLMLYARDRYGDSGTGGITTRQVRAWLKANPQFVPEHLRAVDFHVDHIVGDGVGGQNWPLNYFLMPKTVNLYFGVWLTIEKRKYVGMPAWTAATNFTMWCAQKSRATLPFGTFDPVADKFLSKRSR